MASVTIRLGGLCALLAALATIPGRPEHLWPELHLLFGLLFLGVLVAMLRATEGFGAAAHVAFAGGLAYFAFGAAAEVAPSLQDYRQIGAALLIFATSVVVWRTAVLPKPVAVLAVLGVPPLLHSWVSLGAELSGIVWLGVIGLIMAAVPPVVRVQSPPT